MVILIIKNITNTIYTMQEFHVFYNSFANLYKHVNKLVDNTCYLLEKQIQELSYQEYLIFYPKLNHLIQTYFSGNLFYIQVVLHHYFNLIFNFLPKFCIFF